MSQQLWQKSMVSRLDNSTAKCCDTTKWRHDNLRGATSHMWYVAVSLLKDPYRLLDDFNHGAKTTGIKTDNS